jgi:hypothetical protein
MKTTGLYIKSTAWNIILNNTCSSNLKAHHKPHSVLFSIGICYMTWHGQVQNEIGWWAKLKMVSFRLWESIFIHTQIKWEQRLKKILYTLFAIDKMRKWPNRSSQVEWTQCLDNSVGYFSAYEGNLATCYTMAKSWGLYAKSNRPSHRDKYCAIPLLKVPRVVKSMETETRREDARAGGGGMCQCLGAQSSSLGWRWQPEMGGEWQCQWSSSHWDTHLKRVRWVKFLPVLYHNFAFKKN